MYADIQPRFELLRASGRDLHRAHEHLRRERETASLVHDRELALRRERKVERPLRKTLLEPSRIKQYPWRRPRHTRRHYASTRATLLTRV